MPIIQGPNQDSDGYTCKSLGTLQHIIAMANIHFGIPQLTCSHANSSIRPLTVVEIHPQGATQYKKHRIPVLETGPKTKTIMTRDM
jgi:hypothetical protein